LPIQSIPCHVQIKEKDNSKLRTRLEETFNKCADVCALLQNNDMKHKIKDTFRGDRANGWNRAKTAKRQFVGWTAQMKPWETIPSGNANLDDFDIQKLLEQSQSHCL
jgi:hypothetical protein